jgi:hypothetical protein
MLVFCRDAHIIDYPIFALYPIPPPPVNKKIGLPAGVLSRRYTTHITLRNGRVIYASSYGKRAFRIWVKS